MFWSRNALHLELLMCLSAQHASLMVGIVSILLVVITCVFLSLKNLPSVCLTLARHLSKQASSIKVFWVFLDTSRQIAQSIEPNFSSLYLLDRSLTHPWSIEAVWLLTHPRYLSIYRDFVLDTSSIYRDGWSYIFSRFAYFMPDLIYSLLIQTFSFHQNPFSLQGFSLFQA